MLAKPFDDWNASDIRQWLIGADEKLSFEFKASAAIENTSNFRAELSKDVSSFLNSSGGYIIFGITEGKANRTFSIDDGIDITAHRKEWLEDIVLSNIRPRPHSIAIRPIQLETGRSLYALRIEEGDTAYQARDKKYYKRFNFKAEPMEDHEVKFLVGKIRTPIIDLVLESRAQSQSSTEHLYQIGLTIKNLGPVRARDVKIRFEFPTAPLNRIGSAYARRATYHNAETNQQYTVLEYYGIGRPIFPGDTLRAEEFGEYGIEIMMNSALYRSFGHNDNVNVRWTIFADDAPPTTGSIPFNRLHKF